MATTMMMILMILMVRPPPLLIQGYLRPEQRGRHYICLSLAEAETVRRIMHVRGNALAGKLGVELKLRTLPFDFTAIDVVVPGRGAPQLPSPERDDSYQSEVGREVLRYFNSETSFTPRALNVLLRALQASSSRQRQVGLYESMNILNPLVMYITLLVI
jgi:hypothetical protein